MTAEPASRAREARGGGHGDSGHRGRLFLRRELARQAVRLAADHLLALGGARAESRTLEWRGARLGWLEAGAGPPLLLLHGASGGGANWYDVLAPLAASHRVLAPDLPGFGLSEPFDAGGELSRAALPPLLEMLRSAGVERFDVCGTSFGALVALRLVQVMPERVRRLALVDAAGLGREMPGGMRLLALPLLGSALLARPGARGIRWELRRLVTSTRLPPEREAALVAYLLASARAGDRRWFARTLRRFAGRGGQREILADDELRAVRQPTLVLWGARDRFFPGSHGERLAGAIPRSVLRVIAASGHSPNWERPAEVAALLAGFFGP